MPDPILLDTNVLKDISRGHHEAARALRRYIDSGRTVYVAQASYNELLKRVPSEQFRLWSINGTCPSWRDTSRRTPLQ